MAPTRSSTTAGPQGAVFLTGATGFVGMEILARYLERTDRPVYAPCAPATRRRPRGGCATRSGACSGTRMPSRTGCTRSPPTSSNRAWARPSRARAVWPSQVTDIVHSAASVSFTLPLDRSREINVEGTRRMLELAELCQRRGGLEHFSYISTAYVAGTHKGEFSEDQLDVGQRFRNPYEQSKFEAERLVRAAEGRLPIQVFRPSIVVGERTTGWTPRLQRALLAAEGVRARVTAGRAGAPLGTCRRGARGLRRGRRVRAVRRPGRRNQHVPPRGRAAGDQRRPADRALRTRRGPARARRDPARDCSGA